MSKNYPLTHYYIKQNDVDNELSCSICLSNYQKKEANVVKLNCGHVFHKDCIIPWFDKNPDSLTCPVCRRNIYDPVEDTITDANLIVQGLNLICRDSNKNGQTSTRKTNITDGVRLTCDRDPITDDLPTNRVLITDNLTPRKKSRSCILI